MFVGGEPLLQQDHSINVLGHIPPAKKDLRFTVFIGASPHGEAIRIGQIPGVLAVVQNRFDGLAVVKAPNEIAAFSAIPVIGKVRGNLYPVIFQCGALSQQFPFFFVLVVVGEGRSGTKVVVA